VAAMTDVSQSTTTNVLESLTVISGVRWYHLADPTSPILDELAKIFDIHPLQVEDCRHRRQTARCEEHERYTFVIIKALVDSPALSHPAPPATSDEPDTHPLTNPSHLRFEDFNIFLGADYVLTVDEGDPHLVASTVPRLLAEPSLQSPDCIVYALIDAAVDRYLPALDRLGDFINHLEDAVIHRPSPAILREIFRLKRGLLDFRRVAIAMREAVSALLRRYDVLAATSSHGKREIRLYYRDVYDHLVRVIEFVESYRDLLTGSLDIYLSAMANRTNEVMKVLTLWGTVAMPMLILTSFYGMNVKLPLQDYPLMLPLLLFAMGASTAGVIYYFWRKHWF
jgi:magnesium transporter